jgi:hypothetical protein
MATGQVWNAYQLAKVIKREARKFYEVHSVYIYPRIKCNNIHIKKTYLPYNQVCHIQNNKHKKGLRY